MVRGIATVAATLAFALSGCGGSGDDESTAFCQLSPPLQVPAAALAAALACPDDLAGATEAPVLLIPGTTLTPEINFGWNYLPALAAEGIPTCTLELPAAGMEDIQIAAEYVTYAIREVHARAGRRIRIIGFSQGGMLPRWSFAFWPDTRSRVSDLISLAGSHQGTLTAIPACLAGCAPAFHQQAAGSAFITALNAGPQTYPEIAYTAIHTYTDEVVTPNLPPNPASGLPAADHVRTVAVQSVCPLDVSEHLVLGSINPVGWALALDALRHPGPADPARLSPDVCRQGLMPGVTPARAAVDFARMTLFVGQTLVQASRSISEPPLACYVPSAAD